MSEKRRRGYAGCLVMLLIFFLAIGLLAAMESFSKGDYEGGIEEFKSTLRMIDVIFTPPPVHEGTKYLRISLFDKDLRPLNPTLHWDAVILDEVSTGKGVVFVYFYSGSTEKIRFLNIDITEKPEYLDFTFDSDLTNTFVSFPGKPLDPLGYRLPGYIILYYSYSPSFKMEKGLPPSTVGASFKIRMTVEYETMDSFVRPLSSDVTIIFNSIKKKEKGK